MNTINIFLARIYATIAGSMQIIPASVQSGLTQAKNEAMNTVKFLVNTILIPIAGAVLVGFLIMNIAKAFKKHHGAEPYGENITGIVIIVVILAVVVSSPAWVWSLIG